MKIKSRFLRLFLPAIFGLLSPSAFAWEDPTKGKPVLPWLWEDQLLPTIQNSYDRTGLSILTAGTAMTMFAIQYDDTVYKHNYKEQHLLMDPKTSEFLGWIGNGQFGIGIAIAQLFFDQSNGIKHGRAIMLTAASHITIANVISRERPSGRNDLSFPSGHASSAFTTAGSLSYAYGWEIGVPAYTLATAIALARVNDNVHWLSDVVSGAALGIYWARASFLTETERNDPSAFQWMPVPLDDGMIFSFTLPF